MQTDFKSRAIASLECFREEFTTKELALELYSIYGLGSPVQTWIAHIAACFNPNKPEFFTWCDIVNLCRITGRWEPINFTCDELGLVHPTPIDNTAKIAQLQAHLKHLHSERQRTEQELDRLLTGEQQDQGARFIRSV